MPQEIRQPTAETATVFSYRLTVSGEMRDIALFKSSGNADRDQAALQCAQQIKRKPITIAGAPEEVNWIEAYYWRVPPQPSGFGMPAPDGSPNVCRYAYYPPVAIRLNQEGSVVVTYHIGADGAVKDVAIKQSSGYPYLDGATVTCVEFFRYYPATQNGKPIEIDGIARIIWALQ